MSKVQEKALTAVINKPSLLVMVVGSIQLLGGLYAGVKYPTTALWLLVFNSSVGTIFLIVGMALLFYAKKKEAEVEREEKMYNRRKSDR